MAPRWSVAFARLVGVVFAGVLLVAWVVVIGNPPFGGGIQLGPQIENLAESIYELPSDGAVVVQLVPLLGILALVVYPPIAIGLFVHSRILTVLGRSTRA